MIFLPASPLHGQRLGSAGLAAAASLSARGGGAQGAAAQALGGSARHAGGTGARSSTRRTRLGGSRRRTAAGDGERCGWAARVKAAASASYRAHKRGRARTRAIPVAFSPWRGARGPVLVDGDAATAEIDSGGISADGGCLRELGSARARGG